MNSAESELVKIKGSASKAEILVPDAPGFYAIHLNRKDSLDIFLNDNAETSIIYLGIATTSLKKRLMEQELRHLKPATFFRSLGAVLGYRPEPGSLKYKKNKCYFHGIM